MAPFISGIKKSPSEQVPLQITPLQMAPALYPRAVSALNQIGEASVYFEASRRFDAVWNRAIGRFQGQFGAWDQLSLPRKKVAIQAIIEELSGEFEAPLKYTGNRPSTTPAPRIHVRLTDVADINALYGDIRIADHYLDIASPDHLKDTVKHEVGHRIQVTRAFGPVRGITAQRIGEIFSGKITGDWRYLGETKRIAILKNAAESILREMGYTEEWIQRGVKAFATRNQWITKMALIPDRQNVLAELHRGFSTIHQPFRQAGIDLSRGGIRTQRGWALLGSGEYANDPKLWHAHYTEADAERFAKWDNGRKQPPAWLAKAAESDRLRIFLARTMYAAPAAFTLFDAYHAYHLHQSEDAPLSAVVLQDAKVAGDAGLLLAGAASPKLFARWGSDRLNGALNVAPDLRVPINSVPNRAALRKTPVSLLRNISGGLGVGVAVLGAGVDIALTVSDPDTNGTERALSYGNGAFAVVSAGAVFISGKFLLPVLAVSGGIVWIRRDVMQSRQADRLHQAFIRGHAAEYAREMENADAVVVSRFIKRINHHQPEDFNKLTLKEIEQLQERLANSFWSHSADLLLLEMLKPEINEGKVKKIVAECGSFVLARIGAALARIDPARGFDFYLQFLPPPSPEQYTLFSPVLFPPPPVRGTPARGTPRKGTQLF